MNSEKMRVLTWKSFRRGFYFGREGLDILDSMRRAKYPTDFDRVMDDYQEWADAPIQSQMGIVHPLGVVAGYLSKPIESSIVLFYLTKLRMPKNSYR